MRLVSLDIGNANVKAVSSNAVGVFPSVVAIEQGAISFDGLTSNHDLVIEFEGQRIALGDSAWKLGRLQVAEMGRHRLENAAYRRLAAGALISVLGQSTPISIIASLPVKFYTGDRDKVRELLANDGLYSIKFNGRTYNFKIKSDNVHIVPEAFGSLCCLILDREGQVVNGELASKRVGVIDIGGRTTDGLVFDRLELQPAQSFGQERLGMSELWTLLSERIENNYGRTLNLRELDDALYGGYFWHGPDKIDIRDDIEEASAALADSITSLINSNWDGGNAVERIIFTGGASQFISSWMPYRHLIQISPEQHGVAPHLANAWGAYRFGLFRGL